MRRRKSAQYGTVSVLFPKISVGPIARYRDFAPQLTNRQETVEKTAEGIRRFAYGLGKKVLVANIVGASVDKIYAQDITNVTGVMVWCAAILYAIQIYYDFPVSQIWPSVWAKCSDSIFVKTLIIHTCPVRFRSSGADGIFP